MTSRLEEDFFHAIELHSVERLGAVLDAGLDGAAPIEDRTPIECLIEMYTRTPRFAELLRMLLAAGGELQDPVLTAVLLDDPAAVEAALESDPASRTRRVGLVTTYALLDEASWLHVAAEFGNLEAARKLIELGADLEARTRIDEHGIGGQTPLFHTVNSNLDHAEPVMRLLLDAGARTDVRLDGLMWGKGFPWETTLYDVTPISYAQMGLLPQMHRVPERIYDNIERLLAAAGRPVPPRINVPNRYVTDG